MAKDHVGKVFLVVLCVLQATLLIFVYRAVTLGIPLQKAVFGTWQVLEVKNSNLQRRLSSLGRSSLQHEIYTPVSKKIPSNGWPRINNKSVSFDILPDHANKPFLLMLVLTSPNDFLRRHVIRTTWGGTHKQVKFNRSAIYHGEMFDLTELKLVFVVGCSGNRLTDKKMHYEAEQFGDILRVSLNETYRNIVYKVLSAYSWATTLNPQFVLKADHDVYINVRKLLSWLQDTSLPSLLYTGFIHSLVPVIRDRNLPYYVSSDQLSRDIFPNYCAGPCYVMSNEFLSMVIAGTSRVKIFEVEDAYIGVVSKKLGIKPYFSSKFLWDRKVEGESRNLLTDWKLSHLICYGDSLETTTIAYLYFRYMLLISRGSD